MARDLFLSRGRLTTLSFFIHNFMNACDLDKNRINSCVFKTITSDGPISMCLYNAHRDNNILKPVLFTDKEQPKYWFPLTGEFNDSNHAVNEVSLQQFPVKFFKGRLKQKLDIRHSKTD